MASELLSLREAARILGVHPSTVRSWADQGHLPVQRTQGGHRRFRRQDIEQWARARFEGPVVEPASGLQNVLRTARIQIGASRLEDEDWYRRLDDDAREQYRLSGRSLVEGLLAQLNSDGSNIEAEPRSLGYEYASRGLHCGLNCVEAVRAFLFFRTLVMEAVVSTYIDAGVRSPQTWADMMHKMNIFTDQVLIALLETYAALQRRV
jgi:excisionase family DNA binding protein